MKRLTAKTIPLAATKPKTKANPSTTTATKSVVEKAKKPLTEKQELLEMRAVTAQLSNLSEKNIKAALSIAAQNNPAVLSALTVCNAVANAQEPKPAPMPWRALVDVFIDNRHFAEERAKESLARCQSFITKEFRTLVIGGCRQTGKTQLAHDIVRENPKARLINAPYKSIVPIVTEQVLKERTISDIDDLRNFTVNKDIELLVINQDSFSFEKRNPYMELLGCLEDSSNEFPPNMQVIWIL